MKKYSCSFWARSLSSNWERDLVVIAPSALIALDECARLLGYDGFLPHDDFCGDFYRLTLDGYSFRSGSEATGFRVELI